MGRRRRRGSLFGGAALGLVLIDRTAGTNIGNMTGGGGLAAAFDGNTNQAVGSVAQKGTSANAFVGKTLAAARVFGRAIAYGSNNQGYASGDVSITITVYGKNGAAPSAFNDGTALGSVTFTDGTTTDPRQIESTDLATAWDHIWIALVTNATNQAWRCAELELFAWE